MSDLLRSRAEARLQELRHELTRGRAQLAHLNAMLPQIEGAVHIIEELLAVPDPAPVPVDEYDIREEGLCPNPNAVEVMNSPSAS